MSSSPLALQCWPSPSLRILLHVCLRGEYQSGSNSLPHWVVLNAPKVGIEHLVSGWVKSSFTQEEPMKQFCATLSCYTPVPESKGKTQEIHGNLLTL